MISDPWSPRAARTDYDPKRPIYAQSRRNKLREAGLCINGPLVGNVGHGGVVHGPVVKSGRCQRCLDVHKRSR